MPFGEKQIFRFGPFLLDMVCGQLRNNSDALKLQGQPIEVLEILLQKPGPR
jgi:DNA-binding winged helix-turn-helix (wHTH) protein